jgi:hypothetical protein
MLECAISWGSPLVNIYKLKSYGLKLDALKFLEIAAWERNFEALKSLIGQTGGLDVGIFTKENNLAFDFILQRDEEELQLNMSQIRQIFSESKEMKNWSDSGQYSQYRDKKILELYRLLLRYGFDPYLRDCTGSCTASLTNLNASVKRYFEHCMILLILSSARTIERIGLKTKVVMLPTELLHQLSGMLL